MTTTMTNMGVRAVRRTKEDLSDVQKAFVSSMPLDSLPSTMDYGYDASMSYPHLPPLSKSAKALPSLFNGEGLENVANMTAAVSPTRRFRVKDLLKNADSLHRSLVSASMEMDVRQQEMTLSRTGKASAGRALLESWVNNVLDPAPLNRTRDDMMKSDEATWQGLVAFGLTRAELFNAGLTSTHVDRLYRGLYVYTVGFFDLMQDILAHSEYRNEVLGNVWRAFLHICESALRVAFKSDYLRLVEVSQAAALELMVAREALAEAKEEGAAMEKAVAWLSTAHEEERALRQGLKAALDGERSALDRERRGHEFAVTKYVDEMQERTGLQMQLTSVSEALVLSEETSRHACAERDAMKADLTALEEAAKTSEAVLLEVGSLLLLDQDLNLGPELDITTTTGEGRSLPERLAAQTAMTAEVVRKLYKMLRDEHDACTKAKETMYVCKDEVRATKHIMRQLEMALEGEQSLVRQLQRELKEEAERYAELDAKRIKLENDFEAEKKAHIGTKAQLLAATTLTDSLQSQLDEERVKRRDLTGQIEMLAMRNKSVDEESKEWKIKFEEKHELLRSVSRVFAITMSDAQRNMSLIRYLRRALESTRKDRHLEEERADISDRERRLLRQKLDETLFQLRMSESRITAAEREAEDCRMQIHQLEGDIANMKEANRMMHATNEEIRNDMRNIEAVLNEANRKNRDYEVEANNFRQEVQRLTEVLKEFESKMAAAVRDRATLVEQMQLVMKEKIEAMQRSEMRVQSTLSELQRTQMELSSERTRCQTATALVEGSRRRIEELSDSLSAAEQAAKDWEQRCLEAESVSGTLESQLGEREDLLESLEERMHLLERDVVILMADRERVPPPTPENSHDNEPSVADVVAALTVELDAANQVVREVQGRIKAADEQLRAARHQYEMARALLYVNPTDPALKDAQLGQEAELAKARSMRVDREHELAEALVVTGRLRGKLREARLGASRRRGEVLAAVTKKTEELLKGELLTRLDETLARNARLEYDLALQLEAYVQLTSTFGDMEQQMKKQEALIIASTERVAKMMGDLSEAEGNLKQYKSMVTYLQAETSALAADRDKFKSAMQDAETRVNMLKIELDNASGAVSGTVQRLTSKYEMEQDTLTHHFNAQKQQMQMDMDKKDRLVKISNERTEMLEELVRNLTTTHFNQIETKGKPRYLHHVKKVPLWVTAMKEVKNLTLNTHFHFSDPVVQFCAPSYDMTLVIISSILYEKIMADSRAEDIMIGSHIETPRLILEEAVYDFYASRFGIRLATEIHIAGFLVSLIRYRDQHTKVRMFCRLLGLELSAKSLPNASSFTVANAGAAQNLANAVGNAPLSPSMEAREMMGSGLVPPVLQPPISALPRPAVEFYMTVLCRTHSRVGPLTGEAASGTSLIPCKVLSKIIREVFRGTYMAPVDEVANISDRLRHMANNDEEKAIDMDSVMDLVIRAWMDQAKVDKDAVAALFRQNYERNLGRSILTLDEFASFLRQVDTGAAADLSQSQLLKMYRKAIRKSGPLGENMGTAFVDEVMENSFVGIRTHKMRHESIKHPPPFDEFRLLEESWKSMRHVMEAQVEVLDSHPELDADLILYASLAVQLNDMLDMRIDPRAAWQIYRKLLLLYSLHKKTVDEIRPFKLPSSLAGALNSPFNSRPNTAREGKDRDGATPGDGQPAYTSATAKVKADAMRSRVLKKNETRNSSQQPTTPPMRLGRYLAGRTLESADSDRDRESVSIVNIGVLQEEDEDRD